VSQEVLSPARVQEIHKQAARRRTFAVISHPDAGKSTLTEALALHAKVIGTAGASSGKANRKDTVSDWMQMEKDRGISISSAALQFGYRDTVINLLDTPGHADFSEDTYRVLAAVGPMQFEVVEDRMAHDFSAPMRLERLPYSIARISTVDAMPALANVPGAEVLLRSDGEYLALFNDVWALRRIEKNHPDLTLLPIGTHNPAK